VSDAKLGSLDLSTANEVSQIEAAVQQGSLISYMQLPPSLQRPMWNPPARNHIVKRLLRAWKKQGNKSDQEGSGAQERASSNRAQLKEGPAVQSNNRKPRRAVHSHTARQHRDALLAAPTPKLLGLHARLALLAMPTTLEEDLLLHEALTAGQLSGQQVAQVAEDLVAATAAWQSQADMDKLEAANEGLLTFTRKLAAAGADPWSTYKEQFDKVAAIRDWLRYAGAVTSKLERARREHSQLGYLQQLLQAASSGAGAPAAAAPPPPQAAAAAAAPPPQAAAAAAAGSDGECITWAIKARLEQKMVLHLYVLLCDMIESDLTPMPEHWSSTGLARAIVATWHRRWLADQYAEGYDPDMFS
jgi:hypothetical protein